MELACSVLHCHFGHVLLLALALEGLGTQGCGKWGGLFLTDQLTLSQPGVADYPHPVL